MSAEAWLALFRWTRLPALFGKIADTLRELCRSTLHARYLWAQAGLAMAYCLSFGLVLWVLGVGLDPDFPLTATLACSPAVLFAQNIPITYSGWGAREAMFLMIMGEISGVATETLLAVSISAGITLLLASLAELAFLAVGGAQLLRGRIRGPL